VVDHRVVASVARFATQALETDGELLVVEELEQALPT
jgi:hypothetical protein